MLTLTNTPCRLGKFVNNLDKHGEDDLTAFDVPVVLELQEEPLNELMGDRLFHRRVFDAATPGNPIAVGDGFVKLGPLKFRDSFEDTEVDLVLSSSKTAYHFSGCKISKIKLQPCLGGTTECAFFMHLKPDTDKTICHLLHHQKREVLISISGGKLIEAKKQQELPLAEAEDDIEQPQHPESLFRSDDESNVQPIR